MVCKYFSNDWIIFITPVTAFGLPSSRARIVSEIQKNIQEDKNADELQRHTPTKSEVNTIFFLNYLRSRKVVNYTHFYRKSQNKMSSFLQLINPHCKSLIPNAFMHTKHSCKASVLHFTKEAIYSKRVTFNFFFLGMPMNKNINKLSINIKMSIWYNLSLDIFSDVCSCHCRFPSSLTTSKIK